MKPSGSRCVELRRFSNILKASWSSSVVKPLSSGRSSGNNLLLARPTSHRLWPGAVWMPRSLNCSQSRRSCTCLRSPRLCMSWTSLTVRLLDNMYVVYLVLVVHLERRAVLKRLPFDFIHSMRVFFYLRGRPPVTMKRCKMHRDIKRT